ncbi:VOC family protein [Algicella marina]|uniref:VOC domain-containing protein n=1 Tax=Algicella marina TaxID=2683284 RepID=A0A6P1T621_9RHOB|nr:VOC family protein [Algicella marina]QHQ36012.1 hypothetical protein GO499_12930 [Algicella marina]
MTQLGFASPFFISANLDAAIAFYRDRLGFSVTFAEPQPAPFFAIVNRGGARFMLKELGPDVRPAPNHVRHADARWDAFVFTQEPDELAEEYGVAAGHTQDGLHGFEIVDTDGYKLFFGCPAPEANT